MMKQQTIKEFIDNDKDVVALKKREIHHVNECNIDDIRKTLSMIQNMRTLDDAEKILEKFMLILPKEMVIDSCKGKTKKDLRILFYKCHTKAWSLYHVLVKELSHIRKNKYYEYEREYLSALRESQPFVETLDPMNKLKLTKTEKRNVQHMYNIVSERREKGIFFKPVSRSIIAFCALVPLPTLIICSNISVLKRFQKEQEQLKDLLPMPSKNEVEIAIVELKTFLKDSAFLKKKRYFLPRSINLDFDLLDLWDVNPNPKLNNHDEEADIWYFGDICNPGPMVTHNRFYPYLGEK